MIQGILYAAILVGVIGILIGLLLGFAAYGICMLYDKMSGQFKKKAFLEKILTVSDKSKKVTVAENTAVDKIEQD